MTSQGYAGDLIESPGWKELLADIAVEARAARRVIFAITEETAEETGLSVIRARGSLAVLRNIVTNVYERANVPLPTDIKTLFE